MTVQATMDRELIDVARSLVPIVAQSAAYVDQAAAFPADAMAALSETTLMGLGIPVERGGPGGTLHDLTAVTALLAEACTATAFVLSMHCQQVDAIVRFAEGPWVADVLAQVAAGQMYVASVTTEGGKGGHLLSAEAPLMSDGAGLLVERDAPIVTGGRRADAFLVTMRADPSARPDMVSLVFAGRQDLEVSVDRVWHQHGMRGTENVGLRLLGVVPQDRIVGAPGGFRSVAIESMIPLGHLAWSATWLGAARGAFRRVVAWLRQQGEPLSAAQATRLGGLRGRLEAAFAYLTAVTREVEDLRRAGESLDRAPVQVHLNTVKVEASDTSRAVVDGLVDVVGLEQGYTSDSPLGLERVLRDVRSSSLTYADDRLRLATGQLCLLDTAVRLVDDETTTAAHPYGLSGTDTDG